MILTLYDALYRLTRPLAMATDVETAHRQFIETLRRADDIGPLYATASGIGRITVPRSSVTVGGVHLPTPLILAAGLIKGDGFADEDAAMRAVESGRNIIPGWRTLPRMIGPAEFGSFTRWPRVGNAGTVLWRRPATQSTQNRVGLRNPGAHAAAAFLSRHRDQLPPLYGINIAVSPGVDDPQQEKREALEALAAFTSRGLRPAWFTLNLSCPNTEDDPMGNQTENKARDLCGAMVEAARDVPLWVKISPNLSREQYHGLMNAFASVGVQAVIATNTQGEPTPDGSATAGVGGGDLHPAALEAARALVDAARGGAGVDVIGCGGVLNGSSYHSYRKMGVRAVQYYSAMIYRGPLAAAVIHREEKRLR